MQFLVTTCLILGTSLLAIEAIGRERALRIESALSKLARDTERTFADVLTVKLAPWKDIERSPEILRDRPFMFERHRWIAPAFVTLSLVSLLFLVITVRRYGETLVFAITFAVWFGAILTSLAVSFFVRSFEKLKSIPHTASTKLALLAISAMIGISGVAFAVTFLGTLLTSWPAFLILIIYIVIYSLASMLRRFIDFRIRHNLGNIFVVFGVFLSISGIMLQYLMTVGWI